MNDMLLIIVKDNIQILYVTHMLYLKYILLHFIYACTYSQLATQKPFSITRDEINTVKMQSHCTIDDYYIAQTCHGVGGFTSVINSLHIYINRNNYFIRCLFIIPTF